MPVYEIEQYELHAQKFRVKAKNKAEAIKKLFDGGGRCVDDGLEFIQVSNDIGIPRVEHPALAKALVKLDITVDDVIPSIRSIEEV